MVDFVVIYEHKNRELEMAFYIKRILEAKGFSCNVFPIHSLKRFFSNPRVIIAPFLYSNKYCELFNYFYKKRKRPIINLQYEQILSDSDVMGFYMPKEQSQNAMHIVWGEEIENRFRNLYKLKEDYFYRVGSLQMTLNSPEFACIYENKKDIGELFNIDYKKKWHMFISSFSYSTISEDEKKDLSTRIDCVDEFYDLSVKSRKVLLEWFKEFCENNPDTVFIYRPHPNEGIDKEIADLEKNISNFKVIGDFSIRQWMFVVDDMSTWYSTSIVDAYFARLGCFILRPYKVPDNLEIDFMKNAEFITTKEQFFAEMAKKHSIDNFPIQSTLLTKYYDNENYLSVINRFCDCCERVYKDNDKYSVEPRNRSKFKGFLFDLIYSIDTYVPIYVLFKGIYRDWLKWHNFNTRDFRKLASKYKKSFQKVNIEEWIQKN